MRTEFAIDGIQLFPVLRFEDEGDGYVFAVAAVFAFALEAGLMGQMAADDVAEYGFYIIRRQAHGLDGKVAGIFNQ